MTSSVDAVKERIRRLLAVAKDGSGATQGEIDNAIRFAQAELAKHQLSEEDLAEEPEEQYQRAEDAPKDQAPAVIGSKCYHWESALGKIISRLVGVPYYLDNAAGRHDRNGIARRDRNGKVRAAKAIMYYGIAEDAWLAAELFEELHETIVTMAMLKWGGAFRGDGGSYCEGFVRGIDKQVRNQQADEKKSAASQLDSGDSRGLVLIERRNDLIEHRIAVGKDWLLNEKGIKLGRGSGRSGASGSAAAYSSGRADGARTAVSASRTAKLG